MIHALRRVARRTEGFREQRLQSEATKDLLVFPVFSTDAPAGDQLSSVFVCQVVFFVMFVWLNFLAEVPKGAQHASCLLLLVEFFSKRSQKVITCYSHWL